jgi:hypothetical protein
MTSDDKRAADIKRSGLIAEQAYQAGLAAGQAERDELREALLEYAHHKPSCAGAILEDCDCGLVDILAGGRVT